MKRLIIVIVAVLSMLAATDIHAQPINTANDARYIDISKLDAGQKARLLEFATQMERRESGASEKAREELEKWGDLGMGMGRAAVSAAREIGMAANEFVATPLGKVTMGIVVYKVVGREIIQFVAGFSLATLMFTVAVIMLFRRKGPVKYENVPVLKGLWTRRRVVSYEPDDTIMVGHFVVAAITTVLGIASVINAF